MNISDRFVELLQVAGLVHDIGHGPFSHLYDDYARTFEEPEHEERGIQLFKSLCQREKIPLTIAEISEIIKMINPIGNDIYYWKYQIIANKLHQIDVDKIDYIQRDSYHLNISHSGEFSRLISGARICIAKSSPQYRSQTKQLAWNIRAQLDVFSLFNARYRLHKQVYTHHTVKSFEYLIIDLIKNLRFKYPHINMANMSDSVIISQCYLSEDTVAKNILARKHPKLIGEKVVPIDSAKSFKQGFRLVVDMVIEEIKIGFVSGNNKNPLNMVQYYDENSEHGENLRTSFDINPQDTSFIIPERFQERIIRLYHVNLTKENIHDAREYWKKMTHNL